MALASKPKSGQWHAWTHKRYFLQGSIDRSRKHIFYFRRSCLPFPIVYRKKYNVSLTSKTQEDNKLSPCPGRSPLAAPFPTLPFYESRWKDIRFILPSLKKVGGSVGWKRHSSPYTRIFSPKSPLKLRGNVGGKRKRERHTIRQKVG